MCVAQFIVPTNLCVVCGITSSDLLAGITTKVIWKLLYECSALTRYQYIDVRTEPSLAERFVCEKLSDEIFITYRKTAVRNLFLC
jgi:hypothetical protein